MTLRTVVEWPNQTLETRAVEVLSFDEKLKQLVADMHDTMDHAGGIGLAANQVGELHRVLVIHIPFKNKRYEEDASEERQAWHDQRFTFINPKIIKHEGRTSYQEGCLSFPEIFDFVDRFSEVWVEAQDLSGTTFTTHANGLFAICLQHEIDHLDGVVFIERMSRYKSERIRKKILRRPRLAHTT